MRLQFISWRAIVYGFIPLCLALYFLIDHFRRIKPIRHSNLIDFINIHQTPRNALRVDGVRYENVKGGYPFYLRIFAIESIFFVTEDMVGGTFHVYNLEAKTDCEFMRQDSLVGQGINDPRARFNTFIKDANTTNVTVVHGPFGFERAYNLNLKLKLVEEIPYKRY